MISTWSPPPNAPNSALIENSVSQSICNRKRPRGAICGGKRNPYLVRDGKKADSIPRHARTQCSAQFSRIHRLGAVLRAEADGRGHLWPCPRARRNLRISRPALLRPLLLRAEGRE